MAATTFPDAPARKTYPTNAATAEMTMTARPRPDSHDDGDDARRGPGVDPHERSDEQGYNAEETPESRYRCLHTAPHFPFIDAT